MAFGQQSGPPASAKQVQELLSLLHEAGHSDFRDARGPMGFTQRQAGGKFNREEADTFIEQLHNEAEQQSVPEPAVAPEVPAKAVPKARATAAGAALAKIPTPQLAAELQRRGWIVVEP